VRKAFCENLLEEDDANFKPRFPLPAKRAQTSDYGFNHGLVPDMKGGQLLAVAPYGEHFSADV
jgi:hypothetical protein